MTIASPMVHAHWMDQALNLAQAAGEAGEIPVGALIVDYQDNLIAGGQNRKERDRNPLSHAEMEVIYQATQKLNCRYLQHCRLYVTLEPCPMCAGAIVLARLGMVIFGAKDSKTGAMGTVLDIPHSAASFHPMPVVGGVREAECQQLLQDWFRQLRLAKKMSQK